MNIFKCMERFFSISTSSQSKDTADFLCFTRQTGAPDLNGRTKHHLKYLHKVQGFP